ncbi:hypothetical protein GY45DRAFT_1330007 [Cubamyces sp. BRFM 1775]|nr:hypothetical protein GY45DRAFT_1330007 [Cubamyces sp. BRFM 1775]
MPLLSISAQETGARPPWPCAGGGLSKELRTLLAEPASIHTRATRPSTCTSSTVPETSSTSSLKGAFLYAAPAVRSVLGYDPHELVGRSLTEYCHPADCVPLMRELKDASATPGPVYRLATHRTMQWPLAYVESVSSGAAVMA